MFRALVADDEEWILNGVSDLIENYNLSIKVVAKATTGTEALQLFDKYRPDIVVMDINMPEINGLDVLEKIKLIDKNCITIILSSYADFKYAQKAIELGVSKYETKPINEDKFYESIKSCLYDYQTRILELNILKKNDIPLDKNNIINYINNNYHNPNLSSELIETHFSISRTTVFNIMKKITDMSLNDYITSLRIQQAIYLLETSKSFKQIGAEVGYIDPHYFSKIFKKHTGYTLTEYQKILMEDNSHD